MSQNIIFYERKYSIRIISATLIVTIVAIRFSDIFFNASGKSSLNDIQIIAPAAKPSPNGRESGKWVTIQKAGSAISGWGKLVKILRNAAFHGETHFGIIVRQIASHSGIFWIAMIRDTKIPNVIDGQNDTPIATPSQNEWANITPTINKTFFAFAHLRPENFKSSYWSKNLADKIIKTSHHKIPQKTPRMLYFIHCSIIPKLATIISAPAIALPIETNLCENVFWKIKGIAPNQLAADVSKA